ncbi:MAG: KH domain-containing protein [Clostridia bacterium]|nr:KH domain-containing protein [Clostridia bacterium]MCR5690246.1 KH domain-containing protein [Clostridiales bacterium]
MEEINYAGLLREMVRGLVDEPDAIEITADEPNEQGIVVYHLHVAADDMGRVIGKQGKIANALRAIMRAVANRRDDMVQVDID